MDVMRTVRRLCFSTYRVQIPNPAQITSPYRFTREIYWPEMMEKMDWHETKHAINPADWTTESCRAFCRNRGCVQDPSARQFSTSVLSNVYGAMFTYQVVQIRLIDRSQ